MGRRIVTSTRGRLRQVRGRSGGAERGDIIAHWLVKLSVSLALVGVVAFDAISIGSAKMSVSDTGTQAAQAASDAWLKSHAIQQAYDAAASYAESQNPDNSIETKTFRIDADGTVHLVIDRTAMTLVVRRIPAIRSWAHVSAHAYGKSVS